MILILSFSSSSAPPFPWSHSSPSASHVSFRLVILHLLILFLDFSYSFIAVFRSFFVVFVSVPFLFFLIRISVVFLLKRTRKNLAYMEGKWYNVSWNAVWNCGLQNWNWVERTVADSWRWQWTIVSHKKQGISYQKIIRFHNWYSNPTGACW